MSGGSHDYIYHKIEEAADLIRDFESTNVDGEVIELPTPDERKFAALLDECAKVMYEIEWWRSGDKDRKDFVKAYDRFKMKLKYFR